MFQSPRSRALGCSSFLCFLLPGLGFSDLGRSGSGLVSRVRAGEQPKEVTYSLSLGFRDEGLGFRV